MAADATQKDTLQHTLRYDVAAWLMAALALWLVLRLHLLSGLLSGLLVYELVHVLAPRLYLGSRMNDKRKLAAVALVTAMRAVCRCCCRKWPRSSRARAPCSPTGRWRTCPTMPKA